MRLRGRNLIAGGLAALLAAALLAWAARMALPPGEIEAMLRDLQQRDAPEPRAADSAAAPQETAAQTPPPGAAEAPFAAETPDATAADAAPDIDVLRVERDGAATIAGRAEPGAVVDILVDDEKVGEAQAGRDGAFAAFVDIPDSEAPRQIELAARDPDGASRRSAAPVILAPASRRSAPQSDARDAPETSSVPTAEAPIAVRPTQEGVEIVQRPDLPAGAPVALDALSYAEDGALTLQGRARPGRSVRIYAGRDLIAESAVSADGGWAATSSEPLTPGAYNLRVDEVDATGKVLTRSETPFLSSASPARPPAPGEVVVQPGDTLWAISFDRYGRGPRYAVIFEANKDRIRDPDLIYPGQIFTIPDTQ